MIISRVSLYVIIHDANIVPVISCNSFIIYRIDAHHCVTYAKNLRSKI